MGYPNVSNPSEKLVFNDIAAIKLDSGIYRVDAVINSEYSCRETSATNSTDAIAWFKEYAQGWAKYKKDYNSLAGDELLSYEEKA
jgi:hypothetical protein